MKRKIAIVLSGAVLILICALGTFWFSFRYVEYVPIVHQVVRGDHILEKAPELLTAEHVAAMEVMLDRYHEPYRTTNGKLYIQRSLQRDEELLHNYTLKAEAFRMNPGLDIGKPIVIGIAKVGDPDTEEK